MNKIITCQTCKGVGQLKLKDGSCWDCRGRGQRQIDDSVLRPITELPIWHNDRLIFVCLECSDKEKILVPIQLIEHAYDVFSENKLALNCPRCGFCKPQFETKFKHAVKPVWLSIITFDEENILKHKVWREPQPDDSFRLAQRW